MVARIHSGVGTGSKPRPARPPNPMNTAPKTPAFIRNLANRLVAENIVPPNRIDCGSGYHFGICPKCGKGHGFVVFSVPSVPTAPAKP